MKLCLAILAISLLGFNSAQAGNFQCDDPDNARFDGCAPGLPIGYGVCPNTCRKSVGCEEMSTDIFVLDYEDVFEEVPQSQCGYEYE